MKISSPPFHWLSGNSQPLIKHLKRIPILLCIFLASCSIFQPASDNTPNNPKKVVVYPTESPQKTIKEASQLETVVLETIQNQQEQVLAYLTNEVLIDHIEFSKDRKIALVWLALVDRDTKEILSGEPGLAIAMKLEDDDGNDAGWEITLQSDSNWAKKLISIPSELLDEDAKAWYMPNVQAVPKDHVVYSGYLLPWEGGREVRVSGSIGHVFTYKSCPSTCLYAFDFADGTMFPVVAAKGGRVKYAVWEYPNGNTKHANYLILEDTSTTPTTYQVYYHLAQDSIPVALREPAAEVLQGQFIGLADDTGYSTSHHLHFHVHTNSNSYWGTSVDITFDDVDINGGRPRTCTEAAQFPEYGVQCQSGNWFMSGNGDIERPTGQISQPFSEEVLTTPLLTVRGEGSDDTGITYIQVMANSDGEWKPVGPLITENPFTTVIDLCEENISSGDFFLSLQLMDNSGKLSEAFPGLKHLTKNYSCSDEPPVCTPGENQVALYTEKDFHGACTLVEIGEYSQLTNFQGIGNNNVESIQIGTNVIASLFQNNEWDGIKDTFIEKDPDLSDNVIGINQASSLAVALRPDIPIPPKLNQPQDTNPSPLSEEIPIILSWNSTDENVEFRTQLTGPDNFLLETSWQTTTSWEVGNLLPGEYSWTVWSQNIMGTSQSSLQFTVDKLDVAPISEILPLSPNPDRTAIQLKWKILDEETDLDYFEIQFRKDGGPWEDLQNPISGDMRTLWFIGEPGSRYAFRLRGVDHAGNIEAYPETAETSVLLPSDCDPDIYELSNDTSDNNWSGATQIELDHTQTHNVCGTNDEDWISFVAQAGQTYKIGIHPVSEGTNISFELYGIDHKLSLVSGTSETLSQPFETTWTAPDTGAYFLQLQAKDNNLFGNDTFYEVQVDQTAELKPIAFLWSSLLLPLIWSIVKLYAKLKSKYDPDDEFPI